MIARLRKSYRTDHSREFGWGGNDFYTDNFDFVVKVKTDKPEYYPWQNWFSIHKLSIQFTGWDKLWLLQSRYEDMDEYMIKVLGNDTIHYKSRKEIFAALKKLAENWEEFYYSNGEKKKYEFATA